VRMRIVDVFRSTSSTFCHGFISTYFDFFLFSVVPLGRPTAAIDGDAHSLCDSYGARYHDTRFADFCSSFRFVSVSLSICRQSQPKSDPPTLIHFDGSSRS